jgi:hypothetical protein
MDHPEYELLSLTEASAKLKIAERRMRAAVRAGELPAYRVSENSNAKLRVTWAEVVAWVKTHPLTPEDSRGPANAEAERFARAS